MNNLVVGLKKFLTNKNTVTVVGVVLAIVILYVGYNMRINQAITPVTVPYATEEINSRTQITEDMVGTMEIPQSMVNDDIITNSADVIDMYSNFDSIIPEGSLFYTRQVVEKEQLPANIILDYPKGYVLYNMPVSIESTYGNSIFPGNKIDIYMKVGNGEDELIMIGKLIENIEVLAVKDSSGRAVFENTSEERSPSMLIFGLPADMYSLLKKASYMDDLGVELYPVPHGGEAPDEGATQVSTQQLVDYINAHSVDIPIVQDTIDASELVPTFSANKNNNMRVTVRFPEGCGSEYTCSYTVNNEDPVVVNDRRVTVTFDEEGTLTASVTEQSGEVHTATTNVPMANDEE